MVSEDIVTSLKNAIARGESLETAMAIAISSGYNSRDVEEAAKFVGEGVIEVERISREEILTMPNKKGLFSNIFSQRKTRTYIPQRAENIIPNATQVSKTLQFPISQPFQQMKPAPQRQPQFQVQQQPQQQPQFQAQQPQYIPQLQQPQKKQFEVLPSVPKPQPIQQLPKEQTAEQIKENIQILQPAIQTKTKAVPRQSYAKEIILLILLLILIGILIITFKFREQIIAFFSSL